MENRQYSDEIDLKQLGGRLVSIFNRRKKVVILTFLITLSLSLAYFVKVIYMPTYKANFILKSRTVKFDQIENNFDKYNYYIADPELNPLSDTIIKAINSITLKKISVQEIKNNDNLLNKDQDPKLYNTTLFFKIKPNIDNVEKALDIIIGDVQQVSQKDNETVQNRLRLKNKIEELDSLIKVAYAAGSSYEKKIGLSTNGQLLVMNDLYKGINELIGLKLDCEKELSMLKAENIIYLSSAIFIGNKIEYPWLVFLIAFCIWLFSIGLWMFSIIVFTDEL